MSDYSSKERPESPRPSDPKKPYRDSPKPHPEKRETPPDIYGKPVIDRPTRPIDPNKK